MNPSSAEREKTRIWWAGVFVALAVIAVFSISVLSSSEPAEAQSNPIWTLENAATGGYLRQAVNTTDVVLSNINDARSEWRVIPNNGATVFQNVATNRYLDADAIDANNNGASGGNVDTSSQIGPDDRWTVIDNGAQGLNIGNNALGGWVDGDGIGQSVNRSSSIAADDYWIRVVVEPGVAAPTPTPDPNPPSPSDSVVTFGTIGDWGVPGGGTPGVSAMMTQLDPDIIITLGDNRYGNNVFDSTAGVYCDWIADSQPGPNCPTGGWSSINRFFPSTGNHDYTDGGGIGEYQNHFTIPGTGIPVVNPTGTELYYDFIWGPVHFFAIDSQAFRNSAASWAAQRSWLEGALQSSTSPWQVVFFHHTPYSSSTNHGDDPVMQLPYGDWGADLVLAGHDHTYERIELDTTYIVNGLGGNSPYGLGAPRAGSITQYNSANGAAIFTASAVQLSGAFHSIDSNDGIIESFIIDSAVTLECDADAGVITWNDEAQPKYWIYKSTDGGVTFSWIGRTEGIPTAPTTFTDPAPAVGSLYQVHYEGLPRVDCTTSAEPVGGNGPFTCDSDAGVLTWSDHGASKYWVYRSTDGGATYSWIGRTEGMPAAPTTFTDALASPGSLYRVHYAGIPQIECTISNEPVGGLGPFACEETAAELTWSDHGQPKYWVYRSINGGATYTWLGKTEGTPTAPTSFIDPSPVSGALYQVHYAGIPRAACS